MGGSRPKNKLGIAGWLNPTRFTIERWAYTLHRITGFIMVVYLYMHIIVTSFRLGGEPIWKQIMGAINSPLTHPFEVIVFGALFYHGINGIRLILAELGIIAGKPSRPIFPYRPAASKPFQRAVLAIVMILGIIMFIIVAAEIYGVFGGGA